jgi:hypothetical protein
MKYNHSGAVPIRMKWAGHVARVVERVFWWGNLEDRFHVEDIGVDMNIKLKYNFE